MRHPFTPHLSIRTVHYLLIVIAIMGSVAMIGKSHKKTALLIYCEPEEAERVRLAAKRERRTISGYVMNAVMNRLAVESRIHERRKQSGDEP
jgi:hypothetical protein